LLALLRGVEKKAETVRLDLRVGLERGKNKFVVVVLVLLLQQVETLQ
jgi:hypothetical protein